MDLWTGRVELGSVGIADGWIAYVASEPPPPGPGSQVIDLGGRYLLPGYLEPHCHPDFIYSPLTLLPEVVARGTTGLFCDTLFLLMMAGSQNIDKALNLLQTLPVRLWWAVPSSPRTRLPEGDTEFYGPALYRMLDRDDTALLAEVTRWLDAVEGNPEISGVIQAARKRHLRVDGHAAGARGLKAMAYVSSGITADHEPIEPNEMLEKLQLGLWGMLRHSSLRPDLPELVKLLVERPWLMYRLMLTTDGPSVDFVVGQGYIDRLVKLLIEAGIDPIDAYRMASLNVALYYRIEDRVGLVAPGRAADLIVLDSLLEPTPSMVLVGGRVVACCGGYAGPEPPSREFEQLLQLRFDHRLPPVQTIADRALTVQPTQVPILRLESNVITRLEIADLDSVLRESFDPDTDASVAFLLARDGSRATAAFLRGFGRGIMGLATTLNSACEYLLIGKDVLTMQGALDRLAELAGGIVVMNGGHLTAELSLPLGGRMSPAPLKEIAAQYSRIKEVMGELGYRFHDPAYTLHFLSGDLLPEVRLTPAGIWDVRKRRVLVPPVAITAR